MAKRFTDTELYDREAFLILPPRLKVAWEILNKRCNFFGVWQISVTKLSFEVGEPVTLEEIQKHFKVRIINEDQLYIEGFVAFQYGDDEGRLSPTNRFHRSIAEKLKAHGLPEPLWKPIDTPSDEDGHPIDTLPEGCGEGQGKGQGKGKRNLKRGSAEGEKYSPEFEAAWKEYPRKDDKGDAFRAYQANVNPDEHADALKAIIAYKAKLIRDGTICKHGKTFFNKRRWRDCLDPSYGQDADFSQNQGPPKADAASPPSAWQSKAGRVVDALKRYGPPWLGSKQEPEIKQFLGEELYRVVLKAGVHNLRAVKPDGFQLKSVADSLRVAAELLQGGMNATM